MINKSRKENFDYLYDDTNHIDNYLSNINTEPSSQNYFYIPNFDRNHFDYWKFNNIYPRMHSLHNTIHNSREKSHYSQDRKTYPLRLIRPSSYNDNYDKYSTSQNTTSKNTKEFNFWEKNLSSLSFNKYKRMRRNNYNNYQRIQNNINSYRNDFLIHYTNSLNNSIDKDNKFNKTNDFFININNANNEIAQSFDVENLGSIKVKKNKNLKNRAKLNKEINNFNDLEKKINKKMKVYQKEYYSNNGTLDYNNDEAKNKRRIFIDKFLSNNIEISNTNSNKKIKKKKENEEEINNLKKDMKRDFTFKYNNKEMKKDKDKDENINSNFIKYLEKDNEKYIQMNLIYKQLLDSFFFFINQLSKKYSFKNEIKDVNYYLSNAKDLSNILIDLELHLNNVIKMNEIDKNKVNTNLSYNNYQKENKADNEQELLAKSQFITIKTEKKIKNKEIVKNAKNSRNLNRSKQFLTQNNNKSVFSTKNNDKTIKNDSLNCFGNINESNITEKSKGKYKVIKIQKNNGKLNKMMNKLNMGFFSPNQYSIRNKIINSTNKTDALKKNESNDLKSIINPKYLKENNFKYQ